jgi:DnaK suppressor protein
MTEHLTDPQLRQALARREAGPVAERALAKAEGGTYGMCDRCGGPILRALLLAVPESVLCRGCAAPPMPAVG